MVAAQSQQDAAERRCAEAEAARSAAEERAAAAEERAAAAEERAGVTPGQTPNHPERRGYQMTDNTRSVIQLHVTSVRT